MSIPRLIRVNHFTHYFDGAGIKGLTTAEKCLLWALADEHGRQGDYAEASLAELAHWCRLSLQGVRKALRTLERAEVIRVQRPAVSRPHVKFRYTVQEGKLVTAGPTPKGKLSVPSRVNSVYPQGVTELTLSPSNTSSTSTSTLMGTKIPLPNAVLSVNSDRPDKRRTDGRRKGKANTAEETAILGLLAASKVPFDPDLAKSILTVSEHKGERPTLADLTAWLRGYLARRKSWHGVNPGAIITEAARAHTRHWYLSRSEPEPERAAGCTCGRRGTCDWCRADFARKNAEAKQQFENYEKRRDAGTLNRLSDDRSRSPKGTH